MVGVCVGKHVKHRSVYTVTWSPFVRNTCPTQMESFLVHRYLQVPVFKPLCSPHTVCTTKLNIQNFYFLSAEHIFVSYDSENQRSFTHKSLTGDVCNGDVLSLLGCTN